MEITLLHVPDCPNLPLARRNVDAALARAGLTAIVRERVVTSPEDAQDAGMNGSPTILVDGRDSFAADTAGSIACRLYRDATGVSGAPSVDDLVARLAS